MNFFKNFFDKLFIGFGKEKKKKRFYTYVFIMTHDHNGGMTWRIFFSNMPQTTILHNISIDEMIGVC